MANDYVSLDTIKGSGVLNITGTGEDARLRGLIGAVSRVIDRYVNRHFYVYSAARLYDGTGTTTLLVDDLVSVDANGVKTDDDRDRTFETTWATTDYLLRPSNADPDNSGNPQSRPYSRIEVDVDAGTKSEFVAGAQTVQVTGQWGWWRHLRRASETVDPIADATTTSVLVSLRSSVLAGHTLLVDSEQMYVESYIGNTLTVVRGVNGTTAAAHGGGAAIDIFEYPGPVSEAVIIQTARLWRRKDSVFSGVTGLPDSGQSRMSVGLDPDVRLLLGQYRRHAVGGGA